MTVRGAHARALAVAGMVLSAGVLSGTAVAATVYYIELPLTNQQDTQNTVNGAGGSITGGSFGPGGWITTSRNDIIVVPLPAALDTSHCRLIFTVTDVGRNVTVPSDTRRSSLCIGDSIQTTPTGATI
jgi:hypothetical protein